MKDLNATTFDGYDGEEYCLIDDISPRSPFLPIAKNLLNVTYARANVKFGTLKVNFDAVVLTFQYQSTELTQDT